LLLAVCFLRADVQIENMARWSTENAKPCGDSVPEMPGLLALPKDQFSSVGAAISALNSGSLQCPGFCSVYSKRMGSYYLLWPDTSVPQAPSSVVPPQVGSVVPPQATMGIDTTGDGIANMYVTGVDMNHDGIPDALQQPQAPMGERVQALVDIRKEMTGPVVVGAGAYGTLISLAPGGMAVVQWDIRFDGSTGATYVPMDTLAAAPPLPPQAYAPAPMPMPYGTMPMQYVAPAPPPVLVETNFAGNYVDSYGKKVTLSQSGAIGQATPDGWMYSVAGDTANIPQFGVVGKFKNPGMSREILWSNGVSYVPAPEEAPGAPPATQPNNLQQAESMLTYPTPGPAPAEGKPAAPKKKSSKKKSAKKAKSGCC